MKFTHFGFLVFIKQLCRTVMVTVGTAETFVVDFKRSLPWWHGPSWVVPVRREKWGQSVVCQYMKYFPHVGSEQPGVPREWTGSEHKQALLPCLTGVHCGTGMEPKVHTEDEPGYEQCGETCRRNVSVLVSLVLHPILKLDFQNRETENRTRFALDFMLNR